jgi:hypothetical protein
MAKELQPSIVGLVAVAAAVRQSALPRARRSNLRTEGVELPRPRHRPGRAGLRLERLPAAVLERARNHFWIASRMQAQYYFP